MTKKKLATKMRTRQELKDRLSIFDTKFWNYHVFCIANRVQKKLKKTRERKLARLAKLESEGVKTSVKKHKLSEKEARQISLKAKRLKYKNKHK